MAETVLPTIGSYGNYSNDNYGLNTMKVSVPGLTLYYSYETIVAFYTWDTGLVVCENVWSVTTGKHLNWIDGGDKKGRLPVEEFDKQLEETMARIFPEQKPAGAERKVPFVLFDPVSRKEASGEVAVSTSGITVKITGYGDKTSQPGFGTPVYIEFYDGQLMLRIWDDINREDPKSISLEGAREEELINE